MTREALSTLRQCRNSTSEALMLMRKAMEQWTADKQNNTLNGFQEFGEMEMHIGILRSELRDMDAAIARIREVYP